MGKNSTTTEFIAKAKVVHGDDTFQYHAVEYRSARSKVTIHCPEHGPFQQSPNAHLTGSGCTLCSRIRQSKKRIKGFDEFLAKATVVHQGRYRYSASSFSGSCKPVVIECLLHGPFRQYPLNHLKGHGCAKCGSVVSARKKVKGLEFFLTQAVAQHGTKYDYSKVILDKLDQPVTIICPVHGEFQKMPGPHLRGQGCQKCSIRVHRAASRSGWMEAQNGRPAQLYVIVRWSMDNGQKKDVYFFCYDSKKERGVARQTA